MTSPYFLTTAIDYVNGQPHLGHAYEKVLADVIARYRRITGREVFFLTGVDEHGQKVQQSAQKLGIEPQQFCDNMQADFRALADSLNISYSQWVRTTSPAHKVVVASLLQKLYDKGDIYFAEHEGNYSVRQEQFVTDKDKVNGEWPEIFGEVVPIKEPNYFFRLSTYQQWLREYIQEHEDLIFPTFRRNDVLNAIEKPMADLCISRPKSRLAWGIPLPFDADYVTFVWFDALVNYLSFAKGTNAEGCPFDFWPADLHIIGKDILVPPHGIYWPIMLKALELPIPKKFLVHGWWLNGGAKMSKSLGNSIDPKPYIAKYGRDALRYFLMREMVIGQDADFSDERLHSLYDSDLRKQLGNLLNRVVTMIARYRQSVVPTYNIGKVTLGEQDLRSNAIVEIYRAAMESFQIHLALQETWKLVQRTNQYIEETQPFKLHKDPTQIERLDIVLGHLAESLRRISIFIAPILPDVAQEMRSQLNLYGTAINLEGAMFGGSPAGWTVASPRILFPEIEM